jgi:hypothetical protein
MAAFKPHPSEPLAPTRNTTALMIVLMICITTPLERSLESVAPVMMLHKKFDRWILTGKKV